MSDENQKEQELETQNHNSYENFTTNINPKVEEETDTYAQKSMSEDAQQNSFHMEENSFVNSQNPMGNKEYQGQSNYTNQNSYQSQPNYTNQNSYQGQPNYTNQNSYQGQANYTNQNNYQGQANYAYAREIPQPSEGLGIASLIIGIVTFILFCTCINIPIAIIGVILGIIQLTKGGRKGFAITGIILSALSIIMGIFFWISIFGNAEFRDAIENADSLSYIEKNVDLPNYGIVETKFDIER